MGGLREYTRFTGRAEAPEDNYAKRDRTACPTKKHPHKGVQLLGIGL
jgi:hypothetical protein